MYIIDDNYFIWDCRLIAHHYQHICFAFQIISLVRLGYVTGFIAQTKTAYDYHFIEKCSNWTNVLDRDWLFLRKFGLTEITTA
jgi:hypothetical protein